jgi:hypothetical protein
VCALLASEQDLKLSEINLFSIDHFWIANPYVVIILIAGVLGDPHSRKTKSISQSGKT